MTGRYTEDSIARVREAIDIAEVVEARTDLRRVGGRLVGLCPFHEERTPSFSVAPDKGVYFCFGCGAKGDGIRFVEEVEGANFAEAIEALAGRYGVELQREREDPREEERRRRRARLEALAERTAAYYERFLWTADEAAPARAYLAGRGLGEPVLRAFRVGYAPRAGDRVVRAALHDGFTPEEAEAAGVATRRRGGLTDRFQERIAFPLADARGRVLGFGARALREGHGPKYLNSSENELYHKGRQLFGIDRARGPAARAGRILVVEGYTDVLALHQVGLEETVAVMGTAITPEQLAELSRTARTVVLALDADSSGQEAMLRAAQVAAARAVELRVVALPSGEDPAELALAEGAEGFRARVEAAVSVPEFEVSRVLATADLASLAGRDRALDALVAVLGSTPPASITRQELMRRVADRLDVPPALVASRVGTAHGGAGPPRSTGSSGRRRAAEPEAARGWAAPGEGAIPARRRVATREPAARAEILVPGDVRGREGQGAVLPRAPRPRAALVRSAARGGGASARPLGRPARGRPGERPRARGARGRGSRESRVGALFGAGSSDLLPPAQVPLGRSRAAAGERWALLRARAGALACPRGGETGDRRAHARGGLSGRRRRRHRAHRGTTWRERRFGTPEASRRGAERPISCGKPSPVAQRQSVRLLSEGLLVRIQPGEPCPGAVSDLRALRARAGESA